MQSPDDVPGAVATTPGDIAYSELVYAHSERLTGYLFLLTGNGAQAEEHAVEAFRRVWEMFRKGDILGDAEDHLYRQATRLALQWMQRSGKDRGYQPPTTSRDQDIIAMGVVSGFAPQQRAGVLLVAWGGLEDRLAGVASGVGETRVRDLLFAARQEYREAAKNEDFEETLRGFRISANEETVRDAALSVPTTRRAMSGGPLRTLWRLAAGPLLLVLTLLVLVVIFRDCAGPSIRTGAGRTSDVAFARSGNNVVVLETGTGREIGRVPAGVLSQDGEQVYSARAGCRGQSGSTTISRSDTAVIQTTDLGCIAGSVLPLAVDEGRNVLYVKVAGAPVTLQALTLDTLTSIGSLPPPEESPSMFDSGLIALTADHSAIVPAGISTAGGSNSVTVLRIEVPALRVTGSARFPLEDLSTLQLIPISSGRVLAYDVATGRLRDLDPGQGQMLSATDLPGHTLPRSAGAQRGRTVGLSPDERTIYIAVPDGGIVALDTTHGQVIRRMTPDHRYLAIGVSTDGAMIYGIEVGGAYVVLDATNGTELLRRPNSGLTDILQVSKGQ